MANSSDFWITTDDGVEVHVTLLGYVEFEDKVYVITTPYESSFDQDDWENSRVAIFLLCYVNKKPNFYLVNDKELCELIFSKFSEETLNKLEN